MKTKNQQSENRDFHRMQAIEWSRCGRSAARVYMDQWKDQEETKKEFEETGFEGLYLARDGAIDAIERQGWHQPGETTMILKDRIGPTVVKAIADEIAESVNNNNPEQLRNDIQEMRRHLDDIEARLDGAKAPANY